jgi:hypothetical protein
MIKNWYFILVLSIITSSNFSCGEKCGFGKPSNALSSGIAIVYIDKTSKEFLIKGSPSTYVKSEIKIYNENLEPIEFNVYPQSNSVTFPTLRKKETRHLPNVDYSYRVFIDLKNDRDTIDYFFKIREMRCGSLMEYMRVNYNGQHVADVNNDLDATFKIEKETP